MLSVYCLTTTLTPSLQFPVHETLWQLNDQSQDPNQTPSLTPYLLPNRTLWSPVTPLTITPTPGGLMPVFQSPRPSIDPGPNYNKHQHQSDLFRSLEIKKQQKKKQSIYSTFGFYQKSLPKTLTNLSISCTLNKCVRFFFTLLISIITVLVL